MAYEPPPLPRKPASYSPSFLARQESCFERENHGPPTTYETANRDYEDYDRDFALDTYTDTKINSRPSSSGSAYGRPLPSPPSHRGRTDMPELSCHNDLDDSQWQDAYPQPWQYRGHQSRLSYQLPHSQSNSSLNNVRPLPAPPFRQLNPLAMSMPLPSPPRQSLRSDYSRDRKPSWDGFLQSPAHEPANPFQSLSLEDANSQYNDLQVEETYAPQSLCRPLPFTPSKAAHLQLDSPYDDCQQDFRGDSSPFEHDGQDCQSATQREQYMLGDFYDEYANHSRHTSHEVSSLSISSHIHQDVYELASSRPTSPLEAPYASDPFSHYYLPMPEHGRTYSDSSFDSMESPVHEKLKPIFPEIDKPDLYATNHYETVHTTTAATPPRIPDTPPQPLSSSSVNISSPRLRPPIPQTPALLRNRTLPIPNASISLLEPHKHVKRSSTSTAIIGLHVTTTTPPRLDFSDSLHRLQNSDDNQSVARVFSSEDFGACLEPWSRRAIFIWACDMDISTSTEFVTACAGLFAHTIPTLAAYVTRKMSDDLLNSFLIGGEILQQECTITFISSIKVAQGILPLLTNSGCYAPRSHVADLSGRCYASRCSLTVHIKSSPHTAASAVDTQDWAQFWNLKPDEEPLLSLESREIQRQYQLHEVLYSETDYLHDLKLLRDVYSTSFAITNQADKELINLVFGQIPVLIELSQLHLHIALSERQIQQGPVIQAIGDIFQHWITLARPAYIEYASKLRYADRAIRAQRARNPRVREWLNMCEQDTRLKKLDLSSYQGAPTRRMQRYALLLSDVLKKTSPEYPDHDTLKVAIDMIKAVCVECDAQVKIAHDKISLLELQEQLIWKVSPKNLALTDPSREIIHRGDLQRKSESLTSWQTRDVLLLDNYLVCFKTKEAGRSVISRPPIPVDYLVVDDYAEVLYKSSSTRIIGGTITHAFQPGETSNRRSTLDSTRTLATDPGSPGKSAMENIYPFTVRHAGKSEEKMIFYAETPSSRSSWVKSILEAKAKRWSKVSSREPFEVNVMCDQAFGKHLAFDVPKPTGPSNCVEAAVLNTPAQPMNSVSMSRVQCSTVFKKANQPMVFLVGTDDGVYSNHSGVWTKLVTLVRVSQIAVLSDFGVLVVLADKVLIAYTLDDLFNVPQVQSSRVVRKPPQRLSGSKDVGFFEVGMLKDRMLVIYKKRENGNSVFKALEPVIGKKLEKKPFFKKGTGTDFFRDFDQFFIPAECYGMQYLRSTICIRCSRGFEIMSLDSKQPLTIPDLRQNNTTSLRVRIESARPLGTYRVNENEFLCCFTECGLFVNKYGHISRPQTLEWEGRPSHAVLLGSYVVAIGKEFIEVWHVEKKSLRQVITGKDVRLLSHSSAGTGVDMGIVVAMDYAGKQLIYELRLRR